MRRDKGEKKQKKRRKGGGKRVKTQVEYLPIRLGDTRATIPRRQSIVKAQKPKVKQSAITPTEVAKKMKTTKREVKK
ncbi:MAG TPA: hypothetical protein VJY42_02240 [Candidatus Methanomethylophilaceae archaeon]|nr:hypothetical protein [Candidatus Methanomethylophilaceae archaeon]